MNLKSLITRFKADEDGAVTVDWVVLTGGLVGLAAIIGSYVANGVDTAGQGIKTSLEQPTTFAVDGATPPEGS
jgi:Flp pilus assembly pilin Flp